MAKSLARNSIYYMIYNVINMLFPFLTNLYVAHVLLPTSIGEVNYAQNIVTYFSILAFLGIPTYGLREIARARENKEELSRVFSELFLINFASTVFFSCCYYGFIVCSGLFRGSQQLYFVAGLMIVFNVFNISWLYEGLEEYGFICSRNAVFKLIMFGMMLLLIKNENDIIPYAAITVFGSAGNGIINMIYSRKYVCITKKGLNFKRHIKPVFMLVLVNLAIEIYSLVDTTMIGTLMTKDHVAYYSYASRVNKTLLQITNTITMVLVPRIAYYYNEGRMEEFNHLLTKAFKILVICAVPMIIGLQFTSEFLFPHLFGSSYLPSAGVERILSFVLLISPIGYLLGSRVLLISDNESKMTLCVAVGAIINVVGNSILIRVYGEYGAAAASVLSEMVVMCIYVLLGRRFFHLNPFGATIWHVVVAGALEAMLLWLLNSLMMESWLRLVIQVLVAATGYVITLALLKETVVLEYLKKAKDFLRRDHAL